jgi:hypothetical protein
MASERVGGVTKLPAGALQRKGLGAAKSASGASRCHPNFPGASRMTAFTAFCEALQKTLAENPKAHIIDPQLHAVSPMAPFISVLVALRLLVVPAVVCFFGVSPQTASDRLVAASLSPEIRLAEGCRRADGAAGFATQVQIKVERACRADGDIDPIEQPREFGGVSSSKLFVEIVAVEGRRILGNARRFWIIGKLSRGPPETSAS